MPQTVKVKQFVGYEYKTTRSGLFGKRRTTKKVSVYRYVDKLVQSILPATQLKSSSSAVAKVAATAPKPIIQTTTKTKATTCDSRVQRCAPRKRFFRIRRR